MNSSGSSLTDHFPGPKIPIGRNALATIFIASRSFGRVVDDGVRLLEREGQLVRNSYNRALDAKELRVSLRDMDAALLGNDTCDATVVEAAVRLKVISRHGTGVDSIDLEAATSKGIVVTNTPGVSTTAVAEHTLALMFAMLRRITDANSSLRSKKWEGLRFVGDELAGKTLGIIGLGAIGKEVATKARGLGMAILYNDKVRDLALESELKFTFVPIEKLLKESDIVSIHAPLSMGTRGLIGRKEIASMKRRAYLVNTARGEILDTDALIEGLQSGRLAGAALDVFENEPPDFESTLFDTQNVILTPHIASYTIEALRQLDCVAAENIVKVLNGRVPDNVVNRRVLSAKNLRIKIMT